MSTVKDVAEHCGETIHRLRALIASEAGEDGTELTADTIGELRGLTATIDDFNRLLKRVTNVERDPQVMDSAQIYAMLEETPHERVGDVLLVNERDERPEGTLDHHTPRDPEVRELPDGVNDIVEDVTSLLATMGDLQSCVSSATLAFDQFFEAPHPGKEPLGEIQDLKQQCDGLMQRCEDVTCFHDNPRPLDIVDALAFHAPGALHEMAQLESAKRLDAGRLHTSAAQIARFIRKARKQGARKLSEAMAAAAAVPMPPTHARANETLQPEPRASGEDERVTASNDIHPEDPAIAPGARNDASALNVASATPSYGAIEALDDEDDAEDDELLAMLEDFSEDAEGSMGLEAGVDATDEEVKTARQRVLRRRVKGLFKVTRKLDGLLAQAGSESLLPPPRPPQPPPEILANGKASTAEQRRSSGAILPKSVDTHGHEHRDSAATSTSQSAPRESRLSKMERLQQQQQLWSATQESMRLRRQVHELMGISADFKRKNTIARTEIEVLKQHMGHLVGENRELRRASHNPWPEEGDTGGMLWPLGNMLSRPERETDIVFVYDKRVDVEALKSDEGLLWEQLVETFERCVDMHASSGSESQPEQDAHKLEQLVCDTGAVVCFLARGTLSNWYCVLCLRAALVYGKKVVFLNNPKYFPNEEAQPMDLRDLFVSSKGSSASISFHKDFVHAAARETQRRLSQRAADVAEELESDSDDEAPEHLKRLDTLFRAYICFKRSTGLQAATAVVSRLSEGYRIFCDEGGKLQLHQLKKMVSASSVFIIIFSQEILSAHWAMTELRRALEANKPIILIKDDSFPTTLPGRFPDAAKPMEKVLRREWDRLVVLESDFKTGTIKEDSLNTCISSVARRLGPTDNALGVISPFVRDPVLRKFYGGSLRKLDLSGATIGSTGLEYLVDGLQFNPNLSTLQLAGNRVGFMALEGLVSLGDSLKMQRNPSLTYLDLSDNDLCGARGKHMKGLRALMKGIEGHMSLTRLSIASNKNITNFGRSMVGVNSIADMLRTNRALVHLNLSGNALGVLGAQNVARGVHSARCLTSLDLHKNMIGRDSQDAFSALGEALQANESLTHVNLSSNFVADDGAQAIASALHHNQTLTSLDLSRNDISPYGMPHFQNALLHNHTLISLDLRVNDMRKRGAKALLDALISREHPVNQSITHLCKLPVRGLIEDEETEIDLSFSDISVGEAVILTALVQPTRNLNYLDLTGNVIRADYVTLLKDMCKDDMRETVIQFVM